MAQNEATVTAWWPGEGSREEGWSKTTGCAVCGAKHGRWVFMRSSHGSLRLCARCVPSVVAAFGDWQRREDDNEIDRSKRRG